MNTIFVPFAQAILSGSLTAISPRVWIASVMALAGVAIISLDGAAESSSASSLTAANNSHHLLLTTMDMSLSSGDLLIVGAAFL